MRFGLVRRTFLSTLAALAIGQVLAAEAGAAEPTIYALPEATHAGSLAPATDGSVWFAPLRGSSWPGARTGVIGSVSPDGKVEEYAPPTFENPTSSPTGEVWVSGTSKTGRGQVLVIGRLSDSNTINADYAIGFAPGRITKLAVGPDQVWFVRRLADGTEAVGRLTPTDGSVRELPLGNGCRARAIAAGGNGVAWFTEICRRKRPRHSLELQKTRAALVRVGRVGDIKRRPLTLEGDPCSIAAGHDGSVWIGITFRGFAPDLVDRVTKSGGLVRYRTDGYPSSIAVDADGRVWFRSSFSRRHPALGSITPGGRREKVCADPSCELEPTDLAIAPDGSLWYGLARPNLNEGGGMSGMFILNEIENEAGLIGHLEG